MFPRDKKEQLPSLCSFCLAYFFAPPGVLGGGSLQHFHKHNALKSVRIDRRDDSKTHSVAKIEKHGCFFVKRAKDFVNAGVLKTPESIRAPKMENLGLQRKIFFEHIYFIQGEREGME